MLFVKKTKIINSQMLKLGTSLILPFMICLLVGIHCGSTLEKELPKIPVFDGENAYVHLVRQCAFGPRNPGSSGHDRCRNYLFQTLKKYADEVQIQEFPLFFGSPAQTEKAFNIMARFQPGKSARILLCAHWDTRPWADNDPDAKNRNKPVPGANDGASGAAVLLEISRLLSEKKPKMGVDIVLFDGEDAGSEGNSSSWAQGSAYFAGNLEPEDRPLFGVLIDMIGDKDLNIYKEANSWHNARSIVEKVWRLASVLKLKAFHPEVKYTVMDDHIPLLRAGIPCIDLIDLDYAYWHTLQDTTDKCSAESLEEIGRLLVNLVYREDR